MNKILDDFVVNLIKKIMEIIPRSQAKALHLKKYYTGKPCSKGHTAERYTGPGSCCACVAERNGANYDIRRSEQSEALRALAKLKPFYTLIDHADMPLVISMLVASCIGAQPDLKPGDIPAPYTKKLGVPHYRCLAAPEDVKDLLAWTEKLWSATQAAQRQAAQTETAKRLAAQIAAANEGDGDSGPSDNWMR